MKTREFGRTGLQVSELVFGGGYVGGILVHADDETKLEALRRALMLGLFARGIFLNPMGTKLYLSLAHDEGTCDDFLERFDDTLAEVV